MKKAIIDVGYTSYVVDVQDAITLLGILDKAEVYDSVYDKNESTTTRHIFPQEVGDGSIRTMRLLNDSFYSMAKLAGKPEKK